jgi:hypothetical protein
MKADLTQIEADILSVLLDFTPRNQNQITDSIGKNHDNSTDRVHVHRALKNLEPYLKRSRNELDELGKKWTINLDVETITRYEAKERQQATIETMKRDMETIKQIVKNYPSLIPNLQEKGWVMILLRNNSFFYKDVGDNYGDLSDAGGMLFTEAVNDLKTYVMEMLEYSQTFFKYYLSHEFYFKYFFEIWRDVYRDKDDEKSKDINYACKDCDTILEIYYEMFKHAAETDKINNVCTSKAIELLNYFETVFAHIRRNREESYYERQAVEIKKYVKKPELKKRLKKGIRKNKA